MEHQITEIRKLTKSRVLVTVDDTDTFSLYTGELKKYQIHENGMISPDVYEGIREGLYRRALTRCLHLLKERDYLQGEIRKKLQHGGYPEDIIEAVTDCLKRERFLDDERYIGNYLQFHGGEKSRRAVTEFLKRKGADPKAVGEACESYYEDNPGSQADLAERLLRKKLHAGDDLNDWQTLQKARGFLYRKGFSAETAEKALRSVMEEKET